MQPTTKNQVKLKQSDFFLTEDQRLAINATFADARARTTADAHYGVSVFFEFNPNGQRLRVHSQLLYIDSQPLPTMRVRPFNDTDVLLTQAQLHEINCHFSALLMAHATYHATASPCVTFEFGADWRSFVACFTGLECGQMIRQCYESQPSIWM